MINGQEEIRRGLAAKNNDSATRPATVNPLSYVTSREDDTNSITKTTNRRRFLFSFLLLYFIGMILFLRKSVHDYSLCAITSCMIMPLLYPLANLAACSRLFFFFYYG